MKISFPIFTIKNFPMNNRKTILLIILCGFFITNAVTAEIIGSKIFSVEALLGMKPAHIQLLGFTLDFNMSAGVLNWPIVFIISDLINEYYGVKGVKMISYITTVLIAYTFFVLYGASALPPAPFWVELNQTDAEGYPLNINNAYSIILNSGMGIIIGSILAFLLGQITDAYIFKKLRLLTNNKHIWLRATGSTVFSQLLDSFLVIFVAFYVFGNWEFKQILAVGSVNYIYKFAVAILVTPLIYLLHFAIDKYLGKERSEELIEEATYS